MLLLSFVTHVSLKLSGSSSSSAFSIGRKGIIDVARTAKRRTRDATLSSMDVGFF